jgi:hypothetical protein
MNLRTRTYQGVSYSAFRVRFKLTTGDIKRWIRWSPGFPWIVEEITREIQDRFESGDILPRSLTIRKII